MVRNVLTTLSLCTALSLAAFVSEVAAQGIFLQEQQSGFGVSAGFASADEATTLSLSGGYLLDGMFEGGLTLARTTFDDTELNTTGIAPYVAFYPIRQGEDLPISVRLAAAYEFASVSGDALDTAELDAKGSGYSLGGAVFLSLEATPKLDIVPLVGVSYVGTNVEIEDGFGNSVEFDESYVVFALSAGFAFEASTSGLFTVTPTLGISDGETSFGIAAGYVLPN